MLRLGFDIRVRLRAITSSTLRDGVFAIAERTACRENVQPI